MEISDRIQTWTSTAKNRYPKVFKFAADFCHKSSPSSKILSFGCSSGEEAFVLADKYFTNEGDYVLAVDVDQEVLETARQINSHPRVKYIISAEDKIKRDGPFDAIFAMSVLCMWPASKGVLDISKLFPFERFDFFCTNLSNNLRGGGIFCIYNANYKFSDAICFKDFEKVLIPGLDESGFVTKFSKNGTILEDQYYPYSVFIKS